MPIHASQTSPETKLHTHIHSRVRQISSCCLFFASILVWNGTFFASITKIYFCRDRRLSCYLSKYSFIFGFLHTYQACLSHTHSRVRQVLSCHVFFTSTLVWNGTFFFLHPQCWGSTTVKYGKPYWHTDWCTVPNRRLGSYYGTYVSLVVERPGGTDFAKQLSTASWQRAKGALRGELGRNDGRFWSY